MSALPTLDGIVEAPAPADALADGLVAALVAAFAAAVDVLSLLLVPPHAATIMADIASDASAAIPSFMLLGFQLVNALLLLTCLSVRLVFLAVPSTSVRLRSLTCG